METTQNLHKVKPSYDLDTSIDISILGVTLKNVIVDGGDAENVLPTQTWKKLGSPRLTPTNYSLKLANELLVKPVGHLENIQVNVGGIIVLMDFTIVDTIKNMVTYPALLGRPWLY